ncbi:MAG: hypothetical protein NT150_01590 [Bacteroidetes bacterium]|nr:hypothetical protein [Bacteroidota bacterium]
MRKELLNKEKINDWMPLFDHYKAGRKFMGEYRMESEWCKILINNGIEEHINFGDLAFVSLNDDKTLFFLTTEDGNYMVLKWMFFKVHVQFATVLVHIKSKTFKLIDTDRSLDPKEIFMESKNVFIRFNEKTWINSVAIANEVILPIDIEFMIPIEEFFTLKEEGLPVQIFRWEDKRLTISIE